MTWKSGTWKFNTWKIGTWQGEGASSLYALGGSRGLFRNRRRYRVYAKDRDAKEREKE